MATVFFMKFNRHQGAMLADEMSWHLGFKYGYRPSRYGDNILNLLDKDFSINNDFSAVYGGVGFPCFHYEVVRKSQKMIKGNPSSTSDLNKMSDLVKNAFQNVHHRYISDKLNFHFGFDMDELNQTKFNRNKKDYDIKLDGVLQEARKIVKHQGDFDGAVRIFDNDGVLLGYDRINGINAYHIENTGRGLDFAYPFDAIGPGKELATRVFADVQCRMQLPQRREGFSLSDGLFLLLNCGVESYDFTIKAGGYFQIFIIDGKREVIPEMNREINDHRLHLTAEIIRAFRWGFISREIAQPMMEQLLLENQPWEPLEKQLFDKADNPMLLKKYLMGYKPEDTPRLVIGGRKSEVRD